MQVCLSVSGPLSHTQLGCVCAGSQACFARADERLQVEVVETVGVIHRVEPLLMAAYMSEGLPH
jgi:hypothetical protein